MAAGLLDMTTNLLGPQSWYQELHITHPE